mgnify:CR=1 FL=1
MLSFDIDYNIVPIAKLLQDTAKQAKDRQITIDEDFKIIYKRGRA